MKLDRYEEAIKWCDEGLAVSFDLNFFEVVIVFQEFMKSLKTSNVTQ